MWDLALMAAPSVLYAMKLTLRRDMPEGAVRQALRFSRGGPRAGRIIAGAKLGPASVAPRYMYYKELQGCANSPGRPRPGTWL